MLPSTSFAPHERLLLALCARNGADVTRALASGPDADSVILAASELAFRHGLAGLAAISLEKRRALGAASAAVAKQVGATVKASRRQALIWQLECVLVLQRLRAAGLHPVVLKGAALQAFAYDEPAERSYGDIDLLVPEPEVAAAIEALAPVGYTPPREEVGALYRAIHFHYVLEKLNGFKVELHWALERPGSPYRLEPASFLKASIPVHSTGLGAFNTPGAEYAALHLCVQNVENGFARLSRLVDVDRLVSRPDFSWELFGRLAVAANARVVCALTLELCRELLDTDIDASMVRALASSSTARFHLSLLEPRALVLQQRAFTRPAVEALVNMWCRDTTRDRVALVRDLLRGADAELTVVTMGAGAVRTGLFWNSVGFAKLLLYQVWLYGAQSWRVAARPRTLPAPVSRTPVPSRAGMDP
jgi:hypothetical protein